MLNPLMPMIRTELSLNYTQAGVVISAFSITSGISQLPAGWLADRFGARLMVLLSVSGVATAGLAVGLSHTYELLIAFLVLAALMGGGYHPSSTAAISSFVPAERRGRALGLHLIGGSSTFWIVPLIAAPIAGAWTWRAPYVSLTIPVIVLGVALYYLMGRQARVAAPAAQRVVAQASGPEARIQWGVLAPFLVMSIATGTFTQSVAAYYSLYLVDHFGLTAPSAALLMAIMPAVGAFAAPLGGYLSDRFGSVRVLTVASLFAGPLLYVVGNVPAVALFAAMLLVMGMINMTRMPASESFIAGSVPVRRRATILGVYFFAASEVSGLLTPFIGRILDTRGFGAVFTTVSISLAVIAVLCTVFLWRVLRRPTAVSRPI
jgi:FSR family fosmidomycin resistance protein-like MFS transporter